MAESLVVVEGLGLRFADRWVFRGLDFVVREGEGLAVTGRNGIGKSSLLRVVAGLLAPTEGRISAPPEFERSFTNPEQALYGQLTPRETIELFRRLKGFATPEGTTLEAIGIEGLADSRVETMSTGERARLKIGIAVLGSPRLLLLDEPTLSLDADGRAVVQKIAEQQRSRGAFIMATNEREDLAFATHELALS